MWIGACTSQVGTQIQTTAQSWTVLQLSHNPFYLGVDQFLGQIPIAVLALLAGVLADRRDRRRVLLGSQYTQLACAFIMAALAFTGVLKVWHIWCISRSEEHTSELQSQSNLVCRLLLEKKKYQSESACEPVFFAIDAHQRQHSD